MLEADEVGFFAFGVVVGGHLLFSVISFVWNHGPNATCWVINVVFSSGY